jgi:toxin ParE1/3/4
MPKVLKRPQAETDLDDIWWYIAQDNPDNADRLLDKIEERCQWLAQFPRMGVSRKELAHGLRSLAVGNYLIFYLPIADGIEVVRVMSGMRDIDAIFCFVNNP